MSGVFSLLSWQCDKVKLYVQWSGNVQTNFKWELWERDLDTSRHVWVPGVKIWYVHPPLLPHKAAAFVLVPTIDLIIAE